MVVSGEDKTGATTLARADRFEVLYLIERKKRLDAEVAALVASSPLGPQCAAFEQEWAALMDRLVAEYQIDGKAGDSINCNDGTIIRGPRSTP